MWHYKNWTHPSVVDFEPGVLQTHLELPGELQACTVTNMGSRRAYITSVSIKCGG